VLRCGAALPGPQLSMKGLYFERVRQNTTLLSTQLQRQKEKYREVGRVARVRAGWEERRVGLAMEGQGSGQPRPWPRPCIPEQAAGLHPHAAG
jgi:hypothetical protein